VRILLIVAGVSKSGFPIFGFPLRITNIKPVPQSSIFFELDTSEVMDKAPSREGLEAAHALLQPGGLAHEVKVVFEDHITDQPQPVVGLLM
jgi:hypothetical protein